MEAIRMVAAVTAPDAFQARVLVARLAAEGIVARTDASDGGPYPGGPVGVLVEAGLLQAALEVLGAVDDGDLAGDGLLDGVAPTSPGIAWRRRVVWGLAALVLLMMVSGIVSATLTMTP